MQKSKQTIPTLKELENKQFRDGYPELETVKRAEL